MMRAAISAERVLAALDSPPEVWDLTPDMLWTGDVTVVLDLNTSELLVPYVACVTSDSVRYYDRVAGYYRESIVPEGQVDAWQRARAKALAIALFGGE